jgi:hypothetical protein
MSKVCKKFDVVAEIMPNKGFVRIKVRVLRLWKVPAFLNPSEISSIEMILIDEKVLILCIVYGVNIFLRVLRVIDVLNHVY